MNPAIIDRTQEITAARAAFTAGCEALASLGMESATALASDIGSNADSKGANPRQARELAALFTGRSHGQAMALISSANASYRKANPHAEKPLFVASHKSKGTDGSLTWKLRLSAGEKSTVEI